MRRRVRVPRPSQDPQQIADCLRRLGCTENQIARHLLPLIHKQEIKALAPEQLEAAAPRFQSATESFGDYTLVLPDFH